MLDVEAVFSDSGQEILDSQNISPLISPPRALIVCSQRRGHEMIQVPFVGGQAAVVDSVRSPV